jgi:hypothetical protein
MQLAACLTMRNRSAAVTHAANVAAAERHMRTISPVSDYADFVRAKREYDRLRTAHESERECVFVRQIVLIQAANKRQAH